METIKDLIKARYLYLHFRTDNGSLIFRPSGIEEVEDGKYRLKGDTVAYNDKELFMSSNFVMTSVPNEIKKWQIPYKEALKVYKRIEEKHRLNFFV